MAASLERVMLQAEAYAGPGHFRTGAADSVHLTVRALELYRETLDEEAVGRYREALYRATRDIAPIALDLVGLTLAAGSVMVCAHPVDDNAAQLMRALNDELGEDAWREAGLERDIWYATILHFAADIARPDELIDWVAQRRELDLGRTVIDTVELVRFHYEDGPAGRLMRPEVLSSVPTGQPGQASRDPQA
jgi:hypothetical protein